MKIGKITLVLTCCGMAFQTGMAQELPKWANKARKAVFSVITYNKENQILNTGNGFYIDENGTAVSDYTLFKGAERAVVVTADGKELPVEYILGANDMYDVVKFKTAADKKTVALQPASCPGAVSETVYVLPYSTQKAASGTRHHFQNRYHQPQLFLLYPEHENGRKDRKLSGNECRRRSCSTDTEEQ